MLCPPVFLVLIPLLPQGLRPALQSLSREGKLGGAWECPIPHVVYLIQGAGRGHGWLLYL